MRFSKTKLPSSLNTIWLLWNKHGFSTRQPGKNFIFICQHVHGRYFSSFSPCYMFYCSCEDVCKDVFCENDPSMQNLKVRFYDITVTASDSAGNTGNDTCKVIIVPRCSSLDNGCEKYKAAGDSNGNRNDNTYDNGNPLPNVKRTLQSARKLVGCYEPYADGINKYKVGDSVSAAITVWQTETTIVSTKHNYKCISEDWCGKLGYGPREHGEILAWEKDSQECSVSLIENFSHIFISLSYPFSCP